MSKLNYILLLTLLSFSYELYHCISSYKICNIYNRAKIANCLSGVDPQCYACDDGYSLSNDYTQCINFAHCDASFDEEGKCAVCDSYYNFNAEKQCVKDYCYIYDKNKQCVECYPGFYIKDNKCTKIPIEHCLTGDDKTCTDCPDYTILDKNQCKVKENLIEGCDEYNTDGTCGECVSFYDLKNNRCEYRSDFCKKYPTTEGCLLCEDGYYIDYRTYQCIGYDGSKENLSNKAEAINIKYLYFILILFLLC